MASTPENPDYAELFRSAAVTPSMRSAIATALNIILRKRPIYEDISLATEVPWWMVATIHLKESGLRFDRHLHNGDPLTARTTHVPKGRIPGIDPPYTFAQSAIDALELKRSIDPAVWDVAGCLGFGERYNGLGYRTHGVYSPYVWCGTQHYTKGKFVQDHVFDPNAVAKNPGVAAILLMMVERGICDLDHSALTDHETLPFADGMFEAESAASPD